MLQGISDANQDTDSDLSKRIRSIHDNDESWAPCFAFGLGCTNSLKIIKLSFCCNWGKLIFYSLWSTKLAVIDDAWGTEPAVLNT